VKVVSNFGASDVLMQQIVRGARPTCLPPPTRPPWTRPWRKGRHPATRKNFAANQIVVIVPHDAGTSRPRWPT
jgi:molybdate transport system substrate-binding protein